MSVRNAIESFLEKKKLDFLEKEIASEIKNKKDKSDEVKAAAREKYQPIADKKYSVNLWFEKAAKDVKPNVTTHPSKFTNPKIKNTKSCVFYGDFEKDGYVKTGNIILETKYDVSGNSATNTIIFELYALLDKELDDGLKIISLFESDDDELTKIIKSIGLDYQKVKNVFLSVYFGDQNENSTHELIRQVYFPVQDDYHLLSIATPSMIMFEVKSRIDALDKWIDGKHIRTFKSENVFYEDGFDEVFDITEIGFSHNEFTKMGNVSYLNVKNKGIAYLLPSLPPELNRQYKSLPTFNFFAQTLWPKKYSDSFQALHKLLKADINNINIREWRDNIISFVANEIIDEVWLIRSMQGGWSDDERFGSLPKFQKVMLDSARDEERANDDKAVEDFIHEMARWFMGAYKKVLGNQALPFHDDELLHIKKIMNNSKDDVL